MNKLFLTGILGSALLAGATSAHAAHWVKFEIDAPNKNVAANYYNADQVKTHAKTLSWTEKFVLTDFGSAAYTKHLSIYPACKSNISTKGDVTQHQVDLEIKGGKFRLVAKRNYNKANKLVCSDKDMGTELDRSWHEVEYKSSMYLRYYTLATKYKIGDDNTVTPK
jgi:hypothetical protein